MARHSAAGSIDLVHRLADSLSALPCWLALRAALPRWRACRLSLRCLRAAVKRSGLSPKADCARCARPALQARNGLENYAYSMRNTIKETQVAEKLSR